MTDEIRYITTSSDPEAPARWPRFIFLPWSTCGCPKSWGAYDPPGHEAEPGWWVNLSVESYFGQGKVVEVTGEGPSLAEAEDNAKVLALDALRRLDASTLSVEQLAVRALALALLVCRVEGVCGDGV